MHSPSARAPSGVPRPCRSARSLRPSAARDLYGGGSTRQLLVTGYGLLETRDLHDPTRTPSFLTDSASLPRNGAMLLSAISVCTRWRNGFSVSGGRGRYGVRATRRPVKSDGIPGKTQRRPCRRTTGWGDARWGRCQSQLWRRTKMGDPSTYDPLVLLDKDHLGRRSSREETHPLSCCSLLSRLLLEIEPRLAHRPHPLERLRVVLER